MDVTSVSTAKNFTSVLDLKHPVTNNSLIDVIEWLKEGAYVVVHDHFRSGRYFHYKCPGKEKLEELRVVYLDVESMKGLLGDGEWEYYIKEEGIAECTCILKERLRDPNDLVHSVHLILP